MRAYDRYSRAVGGPAISEAQLDAEFECLLVLLKRDWADSLDQFMNTARRNLNDEYLASADRQEEAPQVLREEATLLSKLKVDLNRLEWFYSVYLEHARISDQCPATSAELVKRLRSLHDSAKQRISSSRPLGRRRKKKRKRQVARGITSLVIGVGSFVANANIPLLMVWSYGVGGGALHQAARDFIGEREG